MSERHTISMDEAGLCDYEFPIASAARAGSSSKALVGAMRVRAGTAGLTFYVRHDHERIYYTTDSISDAIATYNDVDE